MLRNAALLIGLTFAAPACAAGLVMPGATPETYQAYETQAVSQPWSSQQPNARLVERPIGEIIATRLGIAKGSAELFRYHLENAPSARTQIYGLVDGGGIKLKLSW